MLECGAGERYPAPCLACCHSGPPGEVLDLCGAVAAEVAERELGERLGAIHRGYLGHPLFEQRIGELLSSPGPAHDELVQLCTEKEVGEALALGGNARAA